MKKTIKDLKAGERVKFPTPFSKQINNGCETDFSGQKGIVVENNDKEVYVKLDNHFSILNEWNNQLIFCEEDLMFDIEVQIL